MNRIVEPAQYLTGLGSMLLEMKRNLFLLLFLLTVFSSVVHAQNLTQVIRGRVVDETTRFPLIGANVILLNSDPVKGTSTDKDGWFYLEDVPLGRQSIEIRYVGYRPGVVSNMLITSAKEVVLEIKLVEKVVHIDEITVRPTTRKDRALNEMALVSARSFTVEETERFAGSLGDPARMVSNYAGVMIQNDSRNDIIIRGNAPIGLLWRLENVNIPNPNHFGTLGTTGGPISILNNNLLSNSDFLTGAFPAEYGNALSGVFDLNMRSGNNQVREYTGQVGFNGFELGAEGPFTVRKSGPKASYLANFRYSTLEVFNKIGINIGTGEAIPKYKDLTFIVDIPGVKSGRFKIFGLWGDSFIDIGRETSDTAGNSYLPRGMAADYGSGLAVAGLSHTYFFNENTRIKSTLSYQTTNATAKVDSVRNNGLNTYPYYGSSQSENILSLSVAFTKKINKRHNYGLGFDINRYAVDFSDSIYRYNFRKFIYITDVSGDLMFFQAYGQWQFRISDELTVYAGLHFQYFGLNGDHAFEPRASVKWQFRQNQSLSLGIGKHSQMQPRIVYFYETFDTLNHSYFRTNENLKFTRSDHYVLGYDYSIPNRFRIKLEAYYQYLYDVPVKESFPEFSMLNAGDYFVIPIEDSLVNEGTGYNYGIEMTIEKFLGKGYYFLMTTSLFDSKYRGFDREVRNTAFNGSFVMNLLGGYEVELGRNKMLTLDLKTTWAGGKRHVPVDVNKSESEKKEIRDWSQAYVRRYSDYFRTDIRVGFKINGKKTSQEWALDLQNITAHKNIFMEGFDIEKGTVYNVYQQGFFPILLYRIRF